MFNREIVLENIGDNNNLNWNSTHLTYLIISNYVLAHTRTYAIVATRWNE